MPSIPLVVVNFHLETRDVLEIIGFLVFEKFHSLLAVKDHLKIYISQS